MLQEAIVKDFPQYKGRGGLTQMAMKRLTIGAIRENTDVLQLRHNGPAHVFGDHTHCSPSFCKYSPQTCSAVELDKNTDVADPSPEPDPDTSFHSLVESIIESEAADEETARNGHQGSISSMQRCYTVAIDTSMMAEQLIDNETSNLAECYMSIRACFDAIQQDTEWSLRKSLLCCWS